MQFQTIKDVLVFWRESHSEMPLTWFARRVGVSSSTLQRIFDGTTKLPDFATSRSICLNAYEDYDEAISMLSLLYPDKAEYLASDKKVFRSIQTFENRNLQAAYQDYYKWQILNVATIQPLSLKKLEDLGKIYYRKAMELVADDLLKNNDQVLRCSLNLGHFFTPDNLIKNFEFLLRALKEKNDRGDGDKDSHGYFMIDGLSEEGKSEARKLILECCEKIAALPKQQKFSGNLPVSVIMAVSEFI